MLTKKCVEVWRNLKQLVCNGKRKIISKKCMRRDGVMVSEEEKKYWENYQNEKIYVIRRINRKVACFFPEDKDEVARYTIFSLFVCWLRCFQ